MSIGQFFFFSLIITAVSLFQKRNGHQTVIQFSAVN